MRNDLKKIWQLFTPTERRKAIWMLALIVLMAGTETLGVVSILPFLSVLGRPEIIQENTWLHSAYKWTDASSTQDFILLLGFASIAVVVLSSAFKVVTQHAINRFMHLQRHSISARLLSSYLSQPYEFFLQHNSSKLSKNILSEVDQLVGNLIIPLSQLIAQGAIVLAMLLLIVFYDPWMALSIVAVVGALYGSIYVFFRRRLARIGSELVEANRDRYQATNEALGGIKDVKIAHAAEAYQQEFNRASRVFSRHLATNDTVSQTPLYLVEATGYTGLIVIALILLWRTDDIAHVLPALGLYGFAAYRMLPAAQIIYRGVARLRFSTAALDNIHQDLNLPVGVTQTASTTLTPLKEIRLEGVRYAYPSAPETPILDDFNLVIPANTSIGIVGRSGAGKSTLMDILLGLLQPQAGCMSIDGTPITIDNVSSWQRAIGYVPQHIHLTDASVAENIAFGIARDAIDMQAVERAARVAQIHEFVTNDLPDGYMSRVGDRGVRLSGGQRQRIGIARALYRDPPVLLMDEATSALDAQTEEALNADIHNLSNSKTVIVISHKASSVKNCGEIIDIEKSPQKALPIKSRERQ